MAKGQNKAGTSILFIIIGIIIGAAAAVMVMKMLNNNTGETGSTQETPAAVVEESESFDDVSPDDPVPTDEMDIEVIKVNNQGITMKEINVYLYQLRDFYTSQYGESPWNTELEDGTPLYEYAKTELYNGLVRTEILNSKAEEYDVALSDDEKQQCADEAKTYIEELGSAICEDFALTEEGVRIMKEKQALSTKVYNAALEKLAETAEDTSEAALAQSFDALYDTRKLDYVNTEDTIWQNIVIGSVG